MALVVCSILTSPGTLTVSGRASGAFFSGSGPQAGLGYEFRVHDWLSLGPELLLGYETRGPPDDHAGTTMDAFMVIPGLRVVANPDGLLLPWSALRFVYARNIGMNFSPHNVDMIDGRLELGLSVALAFVRIGAFAQAGITYGLTNGRYTFLVGGGAELQLEL